MLSASLNKTFLSLSLVMLVFLMYYTVTLFMLICVSDTLYNNLIMLVCDVVYSEMIRLICVSDTHVGL